MVWQHGSESNNDPSPTSLVVFDLYVVFYTYMHMCNAVYIM